MRMGSWARCDNSTIMEIRMVGVSEPHGKTPRRSFKFQIPHKSHNTTYWRPEQYDELYEMKWNGNAHCFEGVEYTEIGRVGDE